MGDNVEIKKYAVIGADISGLSTAQFLSDKGNDVT